MKFTDNMKSILMNRIQWNGDHTQLCGCFTYAEILYLNDVLEVTDKYDKKPHWTVGYAREKMVSGENGRAWFYFDPRKDLNPKAKTHDAK
jgi:hypothetical protein